MRKLTLSVDDAVVRRAKRYARRRGTSVSRLVERFLDLVASAPTGGRSASPTDAPVLRRLRGSLKGIRLAEYRAHLVRKYR